MTILVFALSGTALADPPWQDGGNKGKFPPGILKKVVKMDFKDVPNGHWAAEAIQRMVLKGVIKGYEDVTFKGNKPVTKMETVVMAVRILGLEDDAQKRDSVEPVFSRFDWGKDYVAIAVEENIIAPEDLINFNPNQPAKRYEVAVLLARALGLEDEAQDAVDENLNFKDWNKIPQKCRGYVYVMVEKGYLNGYPNDNFLPFKPITRAEITKLLAKIDGDIDNILDTGEICGIIADIDEDDETITVESRKFGENKIALSDEAAIFIDDKREDFEDLEEDMHVRIILNSDGEAIFISAKESVEDEDENEDFELEGTLEDLKLENGVYFIIIETEDGTQGPYEIDESVEISDLGRLLGTFIEVEIEDGKIIAINEDTEEEQELEGIIRNVYHDDGKYTVRVKVYDDYYTWEINSNTEIKMDNIKIFSSEIVKGSEFEAAIKGDEILEMEVDKIKLIGEIVQIGGNTEEGYYLSVETNDGYRGPYELDEDADMEEDNEDIEISELSLGNDVEVIIEEGIITNITIQ
jgi:hypothetical protein